MNINSEVINHKITNSNLKDKMLNDNFHSSNQYETTHKIYGGAISTISNL